MKKGECGPLYNSKPNAVRISGLAIILLGLYSECLNVGSHVKDGGVLVKKILMIVLTITILIGGSLYFQNQSSYSEYASLQDDKTIPEELITVDNNPKFETTKNENPGNEKHPENAKVNNKRTFEDIALDKRLDEVRKKMKELIGSKEEKSQHLDRQ